MNQVYYYSLTLFKVIIKSIGSVTFLLHFYGEKICLIIKHDICLLYICFIWFILSVTPNLPKLLVLYTCWSSCSIILKNWHNSHCKTSKKQLYPVYNIFATDWSLYKIMTLLDSEVSDLWLRDNQKSEKAMKHETQFDVNCAQGVWTRYDDKIVGGAHDWDFFSHLISLFHIFSKCHVEVFSNFHRMPSSS